MEDDSIPKEVVDKLISFNNSLGDLEKCLEPFLSTQYEENEKKPLLDRTHLDLMSVFTVTSLSWILFCINGKNPKDCELLENELKRIKDYMKRLKEIEERPNAPRLNQFAARSFVRNALWEPKSKNETEAGGLEEEMQE